MIVTGATFGGGRGRILGVLVLALCGGWFLNPVGPAARGQFEPLIPMVPPQGGWSEVIHVTPQWLVIRNQFGQQFPIAFQTTGQVLIRTLITPNQIPSGAAVECIGLELANNRVTTDHVDVYVGAMAQMLSPISDLILGSGQVTNEFWINMFSVNGFILPSTVANLTLPTRRHLAGLIVGIDPVQISLPGNRGFTVLPSPNGITFTRVERETRNFASVRKGDLVFFTPRPGTTSNPRTLMVDTLVVLKIPGQGPVARPGNLNPNPPQP